MLTLELPSHNWRFRLKYGIVEELTILLSPALPRGKCGNAFCDSDQVMISRNLVDGIQQKHFFMSARYLSNVIAHGLVSFRYRSSNGTKTSTSVRLTAIRQGQVSNVMLIIFCFWGSKYLLSFA